MSKSCIKLLVASYFDTTFSDMNMFHPFCRFCGEIIGFGLVRPCRFHCFMPNCPTTPNSRKHCQKHNGPKALSTLTHATPLALNRSSNKLLYLGKTSAWIFFGKGREIHRTTLTNPCNNLENPISFLTNPCSNSACKQGEVA